MKKLTEYRTTQYNSSGEPALILLYDSREVEELILTLISAIKFAKHVADYAMNSPQESVLMPRLKQLQGVSEKALEIYEGVK